MLSSTMAKSRNRPLSPGITYHGSQTQWFSTWPHTGKTSELLKDQTASPLPTPTHSESLKDDFTAPYEIPMDSQGEKVEGKI